MKSILVHVKRLFRTSLSCHLTSIPHLRFIYRVFPLLKRSTTMNINGLLHRNITYITKRPRVKVISLGNSSRLHNQGKGNISFRIFYNPKIMSHSIKRSSLYLLRNISDDNLQFRHINILYYKKRGQNSFSIRTTSLLHRDPPLISQHRRISQNNLLL